MRGRRPSPVLLSRCRRRALAAGRRERRARERLRAQERLLALIGHDLREPLQALVGHLRLLEETDLPPGQRRHLETALFAASLLTELVNELLDLSRLEAGGGLQVRVFALDPFVRRIAALFEERARRRGLAFRLGVDPLLPPLVRGDPARLRRVVTNLLSNALKYTETGEIALRVESVPGERVRFVVEDTGRGLPPSLAATSRPFARGGQEAVPGFGLGLVIARRLARRLGGRLVLEPRETGGTRAILDVPLPEAAAEEPDAAGGTPRVLAVAEGDFPPAEELRTVPGLLVAPDVSAARARLGEAADAGEPFEVAAVFAPSPEAAAGSAETLRATMPDLLLLLWVPAGLPGDAERARRLGFDAYLSGPFDPGLFRATVRRLALGRASGLLVRHDVEERPQRTLTVLVVEDDPLGARLLAILLERLGHRTLHAADAARALELLERERVDLVLLDLQLPDVHGLELAARIRTHPDPRVAAVPIAVVSGADGCEERARARDVGVAAFLAKPVERDALAAVLARCANMSG